MLSRATRWFGLDSRDGSAEMSPGAFGQMEFVEGSVQRAGERVRISARLVDAVSGRPIWSQTYERELKDVLRLQREVALGGGDPKSAGLPIRSVWRKRRGRWTRSRTTHTFAAVSSGTSAPRKILNKAVSYFEQAAAKDPGYTQTYRAWPTRTFPCTTTVFAPPRTSPRRPVSLRGRRSRSTPDPRRRTRRSRTSPSTIGTGRMPSSTSAKRSRSIPVT